MENNTESNEGIKLMYNLSMYVERLIVEEIADWEDVLEFLKLKSYTHFNNNETDALALVEFGTKLPKGCGYVTVEDIDDSYTVLFESPEQGPKVLEELKSVYEG